MKNNNKRYWWLINLIHSNKYTIGAEIGCANGATTGRLLKYCRSLTLYAVDKWEKVEGAERGEMGAVIGRQGNNCTHWDPVIGKERFDNATNLYKKRLRVLIGDSSVMAAKVKDGSLDFVFIDADHRYPAVIKDLAAWTPKLKPEGTLCGHDIHLPGVKKALDERLLKYTDTGVDHVWFCKKEDYVY